VTGLVSKSLLSLLAPRDRTIVAAVGSMLGTLAVGELSVVFDGASGSTENRMEAVLNYLAALPQPAKELATCRHCGRAIYRLAEDDHGVWFHSDVPGRGFTRGCKTVARSFGMSHEDADALHRKYATPATGGERSGL
jgi:hypothetical protein